MRTPGDDLYFGLNPWPHGAARPTRTTPAPSRAATTSPHTPRVHSWRVPALEWRPSPRRGGGASWRHARSASVAGGKGGRARWCIAWGPGALLVPLYASSLAHRCTRTPNPQSCDFWGERNCAASLLRVRQTLCAKVAVPARYLPDAARSPSSVVRHRHTCVPNQRSRL